MGTKVNGIIKKRVDFPHCETQIALSKLIEFIKSNFDLASGEDVHTIASDAIVEAIQQPFIISNTPLNEMIYYRAKRIISDWVGDESENIEVNQNNSEILDVDGLAERLRKDSVHISLAGSEKQIRWAEKIRYEKAMSLAIDVAKSIRSLESAHNLMSNSSAKWWIENRD